MKKLLFPVTLLLFAGCAKSGSNTPPSSSSYSAQLQQVAASVNHNADQCPFIVGGFFKNDDITHCRDLDLEKTSDGNVVFSDGKARYLPIDGQVHSITKDGSTSSFMGYCSNLTLTVYFASDSESNFYKEDLTLNQTGSTLYVIGSGTFKGAPRNDHSKYKLQR
jgi:hypothetical protein